MTTRGMYSTLVTRWWFSLSILTLLFGVVTSAQANPRYAGIVVDLDNGEVLYAENADERRYPASLTKMMTLYLTFEALENGRLRLDQPLPVSRKAAAAPAIKLWLQEGSTIPVDSAIRALAVRSANDVAVVVAEALGGSEQRFGELMTAKARELGMHSTTFRNASGLPDGQQVTTARDMVTLSVRVMQDFPQYYHYFGLQEFTYRGTTHASHNRLVRNYPGADGLKTGFIRASGFNVATTANRNGRRLVGIVMGGFSGASRDAHMADLLDRSFARASLRDQRSWLANTNFSSDFMTFSGSPQPVRQPVSPQPAPSRPMVASVAATAPTTTPAARVEEQLVRARNEAANAPAATAPDPVQAFIAQERELASTSSASSTAASVPGWGIQVGAFSQASQAEQLAQQAARQLPHEVGGRVAIDTLEGPTKVFRARVVALDEPRARRACRTLKAQGMECMVVNASL
ncbi:MULTISPECIES: D-alanyl-D-alanine carboxypeptidase family protein [Vreelandella]|nr:MULTISPECIES: D-alanyl-D-alanine carboxypeptidase family protein [Halomonas]